MAEYLARVQLTMWAERANQNKKLKFSQSNFNILNTTVFWQMILIGERRLPKP